MSEDRQGQNGSGQHHLVENDDSSLNTSYEHGRRHLQNEQGEQGHDHELVHSEDSTFEKGTIPHQDPREPNLARKRHPDPAKTAPGHVDTEKGPVVSDHFDEENPRTHSLSSYYARYRIFVHFVVWLFFTGSVIVPPCNDIWGKLLRSWNYGGTID